MTRLALRAALLAAPLAWGAAGCGSEGEVEATELPSPAARERPTPPPYLLAVREEIGASFRRMRDSEIEEPLRLAVEQLLERPDKLLQLDGWVARRRSLEHYLEWNCAGADGAVPRAEAFEDPRHPIHAIRSYSRQLAAQGVELLVVPIPTRVEVYPDRLPGVPPVAEDFAGHAPGTAFLLATLAAEGVEVIDLLPALVAARDDPADPARDRLFLDFDPHWTPRAARLAADLVAERLEQLEGYARGPAREGIDFALRAEPGEHTPYSELDPPPEAVTFHRVLTLDGDPADVKDRESPFLLLGDSFAGQYQHEASDLARLLHAATGHSVDTITMSAGASQVWSALARRGDALAGKRWVVWVFTSRAFTAQKFPEVSLIGD